MRKLLNASPTALLASAALAVSAAPASSADIRWRLPAGGTFSSNGSWTGGVVPGAADNAHFGLTVPPPPFQLPDVKTYTVSFTGDQTVGTLMVEDDVVTLNLNGHTLTRANASQSSLVGFIAGQSGSLIITNGVVDGLNTQGLVVGVNGARAGLAVNSQGKLRTLFGSLGSGSGSSGGGTVSGVGSEWNAGAGLTIGSFGGVGFLDVFNGGHVTSIAGAVGASPGPNVATISGAGSHWTLTGELRVGDSGQGTLNLADGGSVTSAGAVIGRSAAAVGDVTLGDGARWTNDGALRIGVSDALAEGGQGTLRIQSGGSVDVDEYIYLGANDALHLDGGELSTRGVLSVGATTPFSWTGGDLELNEFEGNLTVPADGVLRHRVNFLDFTGPILIHGDYDQQADGASLEILVFAGSSSTNHDGVYVDGAAALGGNLNVRSLSTLLPAPGEALAILTSADGLSGSFANAPSGQRAGSTDLAMSFVVSYGPGSPFDPKHVVLSDFRFEQPGDFDFDGDVDGSDFLVWQRGGSPNASSVDPFVNIASDFSAWRTNFGFVAATPSAAAVPEPTGAVVVGIATLGLLLATKKRQRDRLP